VLEEDAWSDDTQALRRIRMGPGLLVYLDAFKKAAFLREWSSAVLQ
jgi:iron(III) transport system substrate-binding protein